MSKQPQSPLHEDDPQGTYRDPDTGQQVRNLSTEEYEASYNDPGAGPHEVPAEVLNKAMDQARAEFPDEPEFGE